MGNVLQVGLSLIVAGIPFLNKVLESSGALFWLKQLTVRIAWKYKKYTQKERLNFHEDATDLYALGCVANRAEWDFELPQDNLASVQLSDSISFHGVDPNGASLTVHFKKEANNKADVFLCLHLADGSSYVLPQHNKLLSTSGSSRSFSAGGLKIQCISPMRIWRISFNGLLSRKLHAEGQDDELVHVKIGCIWTALTSLYDSTTAIASSNVISAMAKERWHGFLPEVDRLQSALNEYEQNGQVLGTVIIDGGDEQELLLWTTRIRSFSDKGLRNHSHASHLYGYAEEGIYFHIATVTVPGLARNLHYGHVNTADGLMQHIQHCDRNLLEAKVDSDTNMHFHVLAGDKTYKLHVKEPQTCSSLVGQNERLQDIHLCSVSVNGIGGFAHWISEKCDLNPSASNISSVVEAKHVPVPLVVTFSNNICQDTLVTGGKGSSLARLKAMTKKEDLFSVPNGIVVTTEAYKAFTTDTNIQDIISKLERVAWTETENGETNAENSRLKEACKDAMNVISSSLTPDSISKAVSQALLAEFGNDAHTKMFAVRSSAAGEDTEDMSAAGQMETFLGVKGIDQVIAMLPNCWASQFSYIAVGYKRRYGQALNSPMAVVIQEMVSSEVAGVMFTCDPLSGNPKIIAITANFGLGESVVSAMAEPDTIELQRSSTNTLTVHNIKLGSKEYRVTMEENGGTKEEHNKSVPNCCLSEKDAVTIGKIGILVEEQFGSPLDIEWAYYNGKAYLLQARPITSLHAETDFEIMHELDVGMRTSFEYFSKANVGEVLPGAVSYLGLFISHKVFGAAMHRYWENLMGLDKAYYCPYHSRGFGTTYNHCFMVMLDTLFRWSAQNQSTLFPAYSMSLFGRILDDPEMMLKAKARYEDFHPSVWVRVKQNAANAYALLFAEQHLLKNIAMFKNFSLDLSGCSTAIEIYDEIERIWPQFFRVFYCLGICSISSMLYNMMLSLALSKLHGGWMSEVYSSFAQLVNNCDEVESADVPRSMQDLAVAIAQDPKKDRFRSMDPKEALEWLKTSSTEAGRKFHNFMLKHGHRCVKEFDLHSVTWDMDPLPLVKTLQGMVEYARPQANDETSVGEAISKLGIQIPWKTWFFLRFLVPRCRRSVGLRERSKSLVIKTLHGYRHAYHHLAKRMVAEGYLPKASLIFHLTHEEIRELLESRNPNLLSKAHRRERLYPVMDSMRFPEIIKGMPRPVNLQPAVDTGTKSLTMHGTAVSKGIVVGTARVANCLQEAAAIQKGDILIAYSTDTGWTPYFPLLSGVATELGGLISHGAVVAREYGLPCVIALHGATSVFRSGDKVVLNGNDGTLSRLEE